MLSTHNMSTLGCWIRVDTPDTNVSTRLPATIKFQNTSSNSPKITNITIIQESYSFNGYSGHSRGAKIHFEIRNQALFEEMTDSKKFDCSATNPHIVILECYERSFQQNYIDSNKFDLRTLLSSLKLCEQDPTFTEDFKKNLISTIRLLAENDEALSAENKMILLAHEGNFQAAMEIAKNEEQHRGDWFWHNRKFGKKDETCANYYMVLAEELNKLYLEGKANGNDMLYCYQQIPDAPTLWQKAHEKMLAIYTAHSPESPEEGKLQREKMFESALIAKDPIATNLFSQYCGESGVCPTAITDVQLNAKTFMAIGSLIQEKNAEIASLKAEISRLKQASEPTTEESPGYQPRMFMLA